MQFFKTERKEQESTHLSTEVGLVNEDTQGRDERHERHERARSEDRWQELGLKSS